MSEGEVDLSQIRGDWYFHTRYVINAFNRTMERANKLWAGLGVEDKAISGALEKQNELWKALVAKTGEKGDIPMDKGPLEEFYAACRSTKAPCDALEEAHGQSGSCSIYNTDIEHFTEACRQVRSLCDDLELLSEQAPA